MEPGARPYLLSIRRFKLRGYPRSVSIPHMTNAVHLQNIGLVNAVPAEQLVVGTRTVWNFGYVATVLAIAPKGKQSLAVTLRSERGGVEAVRTFRKSRLVAVTP